MRVFVAVATGVIGTAHGAFYGPGTSLAPGEHVFELIRKRGRPAW
jgi:hypothetical protein